jgi:hypothetical protein
MPEFAGRVQCAHTYFAIDNDTSSDTGAYSKERHRLRQFTPPERELAERRHAGIVHQTNGTANRVR